MDLEDDESTMTCKCKSVSMSPTLEAFCNYNWCVCYVRNYISREPKVNLGKKVLLSKKKRTRCLTAQ